MSQLVCRSTPGADPRKLSRMPGWAAADAPCSVVCIEVGRLKTSWGPWIYGLRAVLLKSRGILIPLESECKPAEP